MHAPGCEAKEQVRLMWLYKSGEPPGDPNHQIGYDHDLIEICPACSGATLESLRHDCFDYEDVWDQYEWYELSPDDGARMRAIAARCDRPLDPFCVCMTHASLRSSARALPSSSWDTIFEIAAHRHVVTISDGPKPAFALVRTGVELPKPPLAEPVKPKPDAEAVGFVFLAWPALLALTLYAWFRFARVSWYLDVLVVLIAIPASFVVSGVLLAAAKVIFVQKRPRGETHAPRPKVQQDSADKADSTD